MNFVEILKTVEDYIKTSLSDFKRDSIDIDFTGKEVDTEFINEHDDRLQLLINEQPGKVLGKVNIRFVSDYADVDVTMHYDENVTPGYLEDWIRLLVLAFKRSNYLFDRK